MALRGAARQMVLLLQSCRASKVKCDIAEIAESKGVAHVVCTRCERLGLHCAQPPPAKRGRPHKSASLVPHRGAAADVRKLFRASCGWCGTPTSTAQPLLGAASSSEQDGEESEGSVRPGLPSSQLALRHRAADLLSQINLSPADQSVAIGLQVCHADAHIEHVFAFLPAVLCGLQSNRHAQAMVLRQFLAVSRAANDAAAMGRGLLLAGSWGIGADEVLRFDTPPEQAHALDEGMPAFIAEWFSAATCTMARFVDGARMFFLPNAHMRAAFFPAEAGHDSPLKPSAFATSPFARHVMGSARSRALIARLLSSCMLQFNGTQRSGGGTHSGVTQHAQAALDEPMRLLAADGSIRPVGVAVRMCSRHDGRWVWTAIRFSPLDHLHDSEGAGPSGPLLPQAGGSDSAGISSSHAGHFDTDGDAVLAQWEPLEQRPPSPPRTPGPVLTAEEVESLLESAGLLLDAEEASGGSIEVLIDAGFDWPPPQRSAAPAEPDR